MKYTTDPTIKAHVEALLKQGWRVEPGKTHPKIVSPSGWSHAIPKTPSDRRSALNWISQLKKRSSQMRQTA